MCPIMYSVRGLGPTTLAANPTPNLAMRFCIIANLSSS